MLLATWKWPRLFASNNLAVRLKRLFCKLEAIFGPKPQQIILEAYSSSLNTQKPCRRKRRRVNSVNGCLKISYCWHINITYHISSFISWPFFRVAGSAIVVAVDKSVLNLKLFVVRLTNSQGPFLVRFIIIEGLQQHLFDHLHSLVYTINLITSCIDKITQTTSS